VPLFVSPASNYGSANVIAAILNAANSAAARTWVANLVTYAPVFLPFPYPCNRFFWVNGTTTTSTNVDCGIYSWDGTRIFNTGSTAQGTASTVQYVTPSSVFVLDAGRYYFAWTCNNTTNRGYSMNAVSGQSAGRLAGLLEETTGSFGLPATMTPVAWARAWGPSVCGVTRTTTGF